MASDDEGYFKVAGSEKNKKHKEAKVIMIDDEIPDGECPYCKDVEPVISIPKEIGDKIWYLTDKIDTEWIGILKGKCVDGDYEVTDLVLPKQKNTSSHTEAEEPIEGVDVIGWIHSHNTMGAFFSSEDDETNKTLPIGIVVNKDREYKAVATIKTKCDRELKQDAVCVFEEILTEGLDEWFENEKDKLKEDKSTTTTVYRGGYFDNDTTDKDDVKKESLPELPANMAKMSDYDEKDWEEYEKAYGIKDKRRKSFYSDFACY